MPNTGRYNTKLAVWPLVNSNIKLGASDLTQALFYAWGSYSLLLIHSKIIVSVQIQKMTARYRQARNAYFPT